MIPFRSVALNVVIVFATLATRLVAAPSGRVFPVGDPPWVIVVFLLMIAATAAGLWQLLNVVCRGGQSSRKAGLPPEDTLNAVIVRDSSDAMFTINAAGLIQSLNPAARQQFGYTIEEIRDKSISALIPPPGARPSTRKLHGQSGDAGVVWGPAGWQPFPDRRQAG